jgi:hypothetical protein
MNVHIQVDFRWVLQEKILGCYLHVRTHIHTLSLVLSLTHTHKHTHTETLSHLCVHLDPSLRTKAVETPRSKTRQRTSPIARYVQTSPPEAREVDFSKTGVDATYLEVRA